MINSALQLKYYSKIQICKTNYMYINKIEYL